MPNRDSHKTLSDHLKDHLNKPEQPEVNLRSEGGLGYLGTTTTMDGSVGNYADFCCGSYKPFF